MHSHMHTPCMPPTPNRTMRIPDDVWNAAQATAREQGTNITAVLTQMLRRYVKKGSL